MGGRKGGILEEWFRNIAILIFTQSMHAVFLAFILEIIGNISQEETKFSTTAASWGKNDGILAIISMVAVMSLIKMEKMFKEMFGFKDSKHMGAIGENFAKSMAGMKSAISMGARTVKPMAKTAQLAKEKKLNAKSIIDTIGDIEVKKSKVRKIEGEAPTRTSGESDDSYNRRKDEYNEKLRKAKEDVAATEKELYAKQEKQKKLKADMKKSALEATTTTGSTIAAAAFGMGASADMAGAALLANPTDKILDTISGRVINNRVYGQASNEMQHHINNLNSSDDRVRAAELVRMENPGLEVGSSDFEAKIDLKLKSKDFEKQIQAAIKEAQNVKFDMDMDIPTGNVKGAIKALAETYKTAGTAFSEVGREARKTARTVRKEGIRYRGKSIDSVDDI